MAYPVNFNALIQALLGSQGGGASQQPTPTDPALTAILTALAGGPANAGAQPASAAPPSTGPTFLDYLNAMYPGVSGWSPVGDLMNAGPKGNFQDVGNPALGTEWTAMFTPPAGKDQSSYPIYVAGPGTTGAPSPFAMPTARGGATAASDRER